MKKLLFVIILILSLVACNNEKPSSLNENSTAESDVSENVNFYGEWSGKISNTPLEIIISLDKDSGTMSVPVQNITDVQAETISYNDEMFTMKISVQGQNIEISGTLKEGEIDGLFSQNGNKIPITFTPYIDEDVVVHETYEKINIDVKDGTLIAALELPEKTPSALAIIVAGSGGTDKNGNSIGLDSNTYKMLAEDLAVEGIATIRYDKRGIGDNQSLVKNSSDVSIEDYVYDVEDIVKYALQDERFTEVHIIGHSEGALLATLAAQKQKVDSIILLAGAGRTIDEILIEQLSTQLPIDLLEESKNILSSLKEGEIVESFSKELEPIFSIPSQSYLISWIKYNPVNELKKLKIEKYVVHGETDIQVAKTDWTELSKVATDAKLVEGMNHILKEAPIERLANLATYNESELPLHGEIVPTIISLLHK